MQSPFDADSVLIDTLDPARVVAMYRVRCGLDFTGELAGIEKLELYECVRTGYRFWRPVEAAGSEAFYRALSHAWPDYYRQERWEHAHVRQHCKRGDRLLEIGCGVGHFLNSVGPLVREAVGLELNGDAIANKVTAAAIHAQRIEEFAATEPGAFDLVCSYQVLEHVVDPASFVRHALLCLKPGGLLALSTPNNAYYAFQKREDAFDLPPHHMGQFTREVFQKVGAVFALETVDILAEPRACVLPERSSSTPSAALPKWLAGNARRLLSLAYRLSGEPGPGLLAMLRKPTAA